MLYRDIIYGLLITKKRKANLICFLIYQYRIGGERNFAGIIQQIYLILPEKRRINAVEFNPVRIAILRIAICPLGRLLRNRLNCQEDGNKP